MLATLGVVDIHGTTALVTGGAHRVGRAIALALAEAGCHVVIHFNSSEEAAHATAADIGAMGRHVRVVGGDLSDPAVVATLFEAAGDLAPVRVLVNSAAGFPKDSIHDVTPQQWDRTMAVNLRAPVFVTQAFAAALPEHLDGAVVNVTDWRTQRPYPDHFSYTVAKGAIDTFTLAAAEALAPRIRVNGVALGAILPPPGEDSAYLKALASSIPVERVGGAEPVAAAVVALVGNHFITGEILRIDGGAHLR